MDPNQNSPISPEFQQAISRRQSGEMPMGEGEAMGEQQAPQVSPDLLGGQPAAAMENQALDDQTKKIIMAAINRLLPLLGPMGQNQQKSAQPAPTQPPMGGQAPGQMMQ